MFNHEMTIITSSKMLNEQLLKEEALLFALRVIITALDISIVLHICALKKMQNGTFEQRSKPLSVLELNCGKLKE